MPFTDLINLDDEPDFVREFEHEDPRLARRPNPEERVVKLRFRALDGLLPDRMGEIGRDAIRDYVTGDAEYVASGGQRGKGPKGIVGMQEIPPKATVWNAAEQWAMQYPETKEGWHPIEWFILLPKKLPSTSTALRLFIEQLNDDFEASVGKVSEDDGAGLPGSSSPEPTSIQPLPSSSVESSSESSNASEPSAGAGA